jgi:hypothetical protein
MMRTLLLAAMVAGCIPEPNTSDTTVETGTDTTGPGDAGLFVAPAVVCMSMEAGSATGGDINLSQHVVTLSTPVGSGMVSANVTLQNEHTTETLEIQAFSPGGSSDWSMVATAPCNILPCMLAPQDMILLEFQFAPTMIGEVDGTLTIGSCDPDEGAEVIMLEGTGQGTTLGLVSNIGTPPVSIGTGPIGTPISQTFTVENNPATESLGVSIGVSNTTMTNPETFSVNIPGASISMNSTQDIIVTCTPQIVGTVTEMFTVTGMATFGDPVEFAVECTGTSGSLSYVPSSISLGDVRIGSAPIVRTVDLDTSGTTLTITNGHPIESPDVPQVSLTAATPQDIVMGPGSSFDVSFDPGNVEGPVDTVIDLTAGADSASIPFSANVVRATLDEPANVSFGSFCVGKPVSPQTLTLRSTGSATIHMAQRPELEMMAGSPFTLTRLAPADGGYPTDLATNDEATVRVEPKPALAAGAYVDHVTWLTDATNPRTKLEVSFVDDAGGISPGAVMFGMAEVKQSAEPQTVTVQNCAAGEMTLSAPVFDTPGEFRAITAVPATLGPDESATITLVFTPQGTGARMAQMTIPTSTGDLTVNLTGIGLGDPTARGGPASLYACDCSSGDPASGFVIVFALVVPLIPRRRRH